MFSMGGLKDWYGIPRLQLLGGSHWIIDGPQIVVFIDFLPNVGLFGIIKQI